MHLTTKLHIIKIAVNYTKITTHNNQILYESYIKHFHDKLLDIY